MTVDISQNIRPFTNQVIQTHKGDIVYLPFDGYEDQFGGTEYKKFFKTKLKQLLIDNQYKPLVESTAMDLDEFSV